MACFDPTTPAGTDPKSQGDDRIREIKAAELEYLRGGSADGDEAIFPGPDPLTAPIFRHRGGMGAELSRPDAAVGGQYYNTDTGTLQRSNGVTWDDVTENAAYEAIHQAIPAALASAGGVVTFPETGNSFNVSGTEAVTSLAGWSAGLVIVKWGSGRIITHGASLALKNSLSRNVVAGDIQIFEFTGSNAAREIAFHGAGSGVETGTSIMHNGASLPAGFLEENGASLLRADYPGLFAVIGTIHGTADGTHFNLPDMRGFFPRGYDHGAGNDPDAAGRTAANAGGATGDNVGTAQGDEFEAHTHTYNEPKGTFGHASGGAADGIPAEASTTGSSGGTTETRPKNRAKMFCIKY